MKCVRGPELPLGERIEVRRVDAWASRHALVARAFGVGALIGVAGGFLIGAGIV